jgi:transcriptional regulator with XRE-family HTH domain
VEQDTLGGRIGKLREERRWSLAQVAEGHFSRAFLHQLEHGKSQASVGVLQLIARKLDASLDDLILGEGHFVRRQLVLERARLALAQDEPARALELLEPLRGTLAFPLGTDIRLSAAQALLELGRRQEAVDILTAEEEVVRKHDDRDRLAQLAALRQGRRHRLDARGHQRLAEQRLRSGDAAGALDHLRSARILVEAARPAPEKPQAPRSREAAARQRTASSERGRSGIER